MLRIVLLLVGAAVAVGAGYALAGASGGAMTDRLIALIPYVAIGFGLIATLAAIFAVRRTRVLHGELRRLSQSIEVSLREFESRSTQASATIGEMNQQVARELQQLSEQMQTRPAEPEPATAGAPALAQGNVVAIGAARRPPRTAQSDASATIDSGSAETAFRAALSGNDIEISLQPIVSIARSVAAGFEVFAHLPIEGGAAIDMRRAPDSIDAAERAAFERKLVITAAEAGRRRVGAISEAIPLHVAVSHALLGNAAEMAAVFDMLALYPSIARSLVLSVPHSVVLKADQHAATVGQLSEAGIRIAVEGWPEANDAAGMIRRLGASLVKLPANRLLDRDKTRRKLTPAATLIEYAGVEDIELIATDVSNDEDVVSLIDLGIDLMCGERFSGPKLLKPEGGARSAKLPLASSMVNPA
ncbi:MAG: EAL domain-containing protein [Rhizobiaceae bacterium]